MRIEDAALAVWFAANDLYYDDERELKSIELLAEDSKYPACRTMLFLVETWL